MGVSGPESGGRWPTAGAVIVCDDMALKRRRGKKQLLLGDSHWKAVRKRLAGLVAADARNNGSLHSDSRG